jgi:uncharacterized repeat protein (TIGR03803 family)
MKVAELMKTKLLSIVVGLVCVTPWLALAQPMITTQPANIFLDAPAKVTFTVGASGTGPLSYQWLFEGTPIPGANSSSLKLSTSQCAQPSLWGYYSVIVSDATGSVTSRAAELKIFVPAPHSISAAQAQPDGSVLLSFAGETTAAFAPYYDEHPVEVSSDQVHWAPLVTLQRANTSLDALQFVDTVTPRFTPRFYRTPPNILDTPDPKPTGPYSVGTFSMVMTDPSRTNAAGGGINYQFMTTFWYPTVPQAGVLPAIYVEPQLALSPPYQYEEGMNTNIETQNWSAQVAAFFSHSLSNAPLAGNLAKYPVVLYDPGMFGNRRGNTDRAEELASWGYVVIGLDAIDTYVSVFPNGTVVPGQPVDFASLSAYGGWVAVTENRLQDMQFVLDQLARLNSADPRMAGRLDLDRVGAFGYSCGGWTTAELCFRDSRCKAGAGMDGWFFENDVLTQPLGVPFLDFRSDMGPDPDPGCELWRDGRMQFYRQQPANAYWVKLASANHVYFHNVALIWDSATIAADSGTPMSGQIQTGGRVSQVLRAYLLSFFNKHLLGVDDHLLDGPSPAYPEVIQFLSAGVSTPPEYPTAALVQGSDGNFYGTTAYGGTSGNGTVFRVTPNGLLATLVSFNGANGSHPAAALVQGSDGNFYGTTAFGGTGGNNGTVFRMTPGGVLTTLISFNGANGSEPFAGLMQGSDGNFYGTTMLGGADNFGTVFSITPAGALTTLASFNGANGSFPFGGLVQGTDGSFYGTASYSSPTGGYGPGTAFKLTPAGVLTPLVAFGGPHGANPAAALVLGPGGALYGTTEYGGNADLNRNYTGGFGSVFAMTPKGALTTLYSFSGTDGSYCVSGLVQGSDGSFYGTTAGGGVGGAGTVFKLSPRGAFTTLVAFNGANGNSPQAALIQGSDGNFYGTTTYGGPGGAGTVFKMTPSGVLTTLVAFGAN